ncbi:DUF2442 domain-containing protein [Cellulomonas sp. zg-ZUI188]|uniref:DUF2442 domain-containing protein n=2 Tax=Cellulomonas fengjieae TaxID=2819978 RepID=A0ABS3SED5_9CELL|nr:DUF2442 domain-containing protein [Cellulomonas fengjieae]MBO3084118.1 DUF2442 domain-containing protein [Cellulomonas fengjieae]QVI67905.1 DUF2442 domain-containing protein [Cellulomonas fengjieae]
MTCRRSAPAAGRKLWLQYTDRTAGEVDLIPMLQRQLLAAVRDDNGLFAQVVVDESGTLAWPDGADLAPEVLHKLAAPHLRQQA